MRGGELSELATERWEWEWHEAMRARELHIPYVKRVGSFMFEKKHETPDRHLLPPASRPH
jgi:hypothetical protein